jgi:hypothetical protein
MDIPPDQKAELFHAILYRKGCRTLRGVPRQTASPGSLRERVQSIFDTVKE